MNPNYTTLNKDIGLIQRSNNGWDLWFDNGDLVSAEDFHSLQVGIIIACLTSWNYMNRYGNPTYEIFGNRAYQLLKANKTSMVQYKIEQFFLECLKRMRRVYEVVSLTVSEVPYEPHMYRVWFEVISINNQLVDGSFTVSTDASKSTSYIQYDVLMPYASNENDLVIDLWLRNEYGGGLEGEVLYMYLKRGDGDYEFRGVVGETDENGYLRVTYNPWDDEDDESRHYDDVNIIYFDFHGNSTYNPSTSKRTQFKTELYEYDVMFLDDDSNDSNRYVDLRVRLRKKPLLDNEWIPMSYTTVTVLGSDGAIYDVVTDPNGEATFRAKISQEETKFTVSYNGSSPDYVMHTVVKETPTVSLSANRESLLVGEPLILTADVGMSGFDVEFYMDNTLIETLTTGEDGKATLSMSALLKGLGIETLLSGTYSFTAIVKENVFYNSVNDSVNISVNKHDIDVVLSVSDAPLVVGNNVAFTATVTEDGSNLYDLTVSFTENNSEIGTAITTDGIAILYIDTLGVGEHTITATVIENDYYLSGSTTVTFTIIDHNYDLSLNVRKLGSAIQNDNSITYSYGITPYITDNGFNVDTFDLTGKNIVISSEDTGDEWTLTEYVKDETVCTIDYTTNSSDTISFDATWEEYDIETSETVTTPYWEDYCTINSSSNYQDITFSLGSLGGGSQVVSNELCKNNWTIVDGYTVTNSSIRNSGAYEPIHYTATQPISIDLTPTVTDQWSYGEGFYCGVKRKHNDDFNYETDLEGEGHGFNTVLDTGDELWVIVESSQQVVYDIWTVPVPYANLTYDSSQQSYLLSSDDTGEMNISKAIPNSINSNKIKVSCKVNLTSNSNDNEFILGLTDSKNFESNQYGLISVTANGIVKYIRKSSTGVYTLFEENTYETFEDTWITLELEETPHLIIGTVYDENNEIIATTTQNKSVSFSYVFLSTKNNTNGNYVKDIKIERTNPITPTTILYDECSSNNGLNNYGLSILFNDGDTTSTNTLTYENNQYILNGNGNYFSGREILSLSGEDNAKLRIRFKLKYNNYNAFEQLLIGCTDLDLATRNSKDCFYRVRNDKKLQVYDLNGTESTLYTHPTYFNGDWYYLELERVNNNATITLYTSSMDILYTGTRTVTAFTNTPKWYFGLQTEKGTDYQIYISEIYAERL